MFVNVIVNNIKTDFDTVFIINEFQLFLLSYADDQVIFSISTVTLQFLVKKYIFLSRELSLINTSCLRADHEIIIHDEARAN